MLNLSNVHLTFNRFHRPVLKNINLTVHKGDFLVIIGGNGSGKSSLLKTIQGLYKPTKGSITLNEKAIDAFNLEELASSIQTLTQELTQSTFGSLSVFENCHLADRGSKAFHGSSSLIANYLESFSSSLAHHLHSPVSRLSGGQRQTLALAMALIHPPELLLLDEHTSALDPKTAHKLMEKTYKCLATQGVTTLMVTHELDDALSLGNRLIALKEGQIVFEADKLAKGKLTREDLLHLCY